MKNSDLLSLGKRDYDIFFVLTIILSATICLFGISTLPLQLWDEGRQAVNALEMVKNNNYIITTYNNQPDLWNTKPPLLIWLIYISFKILGISEFALRLPSAISMIALTIFIFFTMKKQIHSSFLAFFCCSIILTCGGLIRGHVARTADYDSLLILSIAVYSISFYNYLITNKNRHLVIFAIFLAIGTLTKGIAACVPLPAIIFFLLIYYRSQLKNYKIYLFGFLGIAPILLFYIIREQISTGYLIAIYQNELGGRFLETIENHQKPWHYYLENIFNKRFFPWFLTIPLLPIFAFKGRLGLNYKLFIYSIIHIIWILTIFSISKTKLSWYSAPIFPFLAIAITISLNYIIKNSTVKYSIMLILVLTGIIHILQLTKSENFNRNEKIIAIESFLDKELNSLSSYDTLTFYNEYDSPILFKILARNLQNGSGTKIKYLEDHTTIIKNDTLLVVKGINDHFIFQSSIDTLMINTHSLVLKLK